MLFQCQSWDENSKMFYTIKPILINFLSYRADFSLLTIVARSSFFNWFYAASTEILD